MRLDLRWKDFKMFFFHFLTMYNTCLLYILQIFMEFLLLASITMVPEIESEINQDPFLQDLSLMEEVWF